VKDILSFEVLEYKPELTHSVWIKMILRNRTYEAKRRELRKLVKAGTFVGYRIVTVHEEHIGVTWPKDGA